MKIKLPKLVLTVGVRLVMLSIASVAEAGINLNGSSLTGQKIEKQSQQQSKRMRSNGSSSTGQTTEKQLPQQLKGVPRNGSSLTGQVSQQQ